jgi:hypothetical protein
MTENVDCHESLYNLKRDCSDKIYVPACEDPRIEMMLSGINQPDVEDSSEFPTEGYFPNIPETDIILSSTNEQITDDGYLVQRCIKITAEYNKITESGDEEIKSGEYYTLLRYDINTCNKTIEGIRTYCMVLNLCEEIQQYDELK